jgi:serine/threonine-protein kinase
VYPRISPDGRQLALDIRDTESDIWVFDFSRRNFQRLTFDAGLNRGAVWTSDSRRLVFSREMDGAESLFWQDADGSGEPERLTTATPGRPQVPYSITPDGTLLFGEPGQPPFDLFSLSLRADRRRAPVLNAPHSEHNAEISPNGRWLAYQSDESGANEVYVRRYPSLDSRKQISNGGGTRPLWARNGRELFYMKPDGTLAVVPIDRDDANTFAAATEKALFPGAYYALQAGRTYDVAPDGKRFLMIKEAMLTKTPVQLLVVQHWFEELKRQVPDR